jgi:DNA primase
MREDLQSLKQRISLLEYLKQINWRARRVGANHEFVGLCPLHPESRPSFYVNSSKNLFYCHGCGRGGDLIRFVQLSLNLSLQETIAHLKQCPGLPEPGQDQALIETVDFYQRQLQQHTEALDYLHRRGVHDVKLIRQLKIGYAPGGMLYRHLSRLGYSSDLLAQLGLIHRGTDTFYRRIIFPCFDASRPANLYGRSISGSAPHRFLPRSKGGLFAWSTIGNCTEIILVEGLFDLAILWQAGFTNTTCAFGVYLTSRQISQLSEGPRRTLFIAFDSDRAGQHAALLLAQRLCTAALQVRIIDLPAGEDPNSYFVSGASAAQFENCLRNARSL